MCTYVNSDGHSLQRGEQEQHDEAIQQPGVGPGERGLVRQADLRGRQVQGPAVCGEEGRADPVSAAGQGASCSPCCW